MHARPPKGKRPFLRFLVLLFPLLLAACDAVKPSSVQEVAVQGLVSGALSRDGTFAVMGSLQHGGGGWDVQTGNRLYNWNHQAGQYTTLRAAALSGDGRIALTVNDRELAVWDTNTGESLHFWQASAKVLSAALSGDGGLAVLGMQNNQAVLFDVRAGAERQVFAHEAEVFSVAIDDAGTRVLTGSDDFSVVLWDGANGAVLHRFAQENQVKRVALSSDGALLFSAAQRQPGRVYDAVSGDVLITVPLKYENYTAARFSDDNRQLLLGTFRGDLHLFALEGAKQVVHWQAASRSALAGGSRSGAILSAAYTNQGAVALVSDGTVQHFER